jgi:hypothetical protein
MKAYGVICAVTPRSISGLSCNYVEQAFKTCGILSCSTGKSSRFENRKVFLRADKNCEARELRKSSMKVK